MINWNNVVSAVATNEGLVVQERRADGTLGAPVTYAAIPHPGGPRSPSVLPHPMTPGTFMFQVWQGNKQVVSTSAEQLTAFGAKQRADALLIKYGGCNIFGNSLPEFPCCASVGTGAGTGFGRSCVQAYNWVGGKWIPIDWKDGAWHQKPPPLTYSPGYKF